MSRVAFADACTDSSVAAKHSKRRDSTVEGDGTPDIDEFTRIEQAAMMEEEVPPPPAPPPPPPSEDAWLKYLAAESNGLTVHPDQEFPPPPPPKPPSTSDIELLRGVSFLSGSALQKRRRTSILVN